VYLCNRWRRYNFFSGGGGAVQGWLDQGRRQGSIYDFAATGAYNFLPPFIFIFR